MSLNGGPRLERERGVRLGLSLKILLTYVYGAVLSAPTHAYTQCSTRVHHIWVGDEGYVWIHLESGGAAVIGPADPDREATLSVATTALVAGRQVVVRYAADGVSCTEVRSDFSGIYLY